MNRLLFLLAGVILFCANSALGQANFAFRNGYLGVNAPVYDSQGVPLAGTAYRAELWGGDTASSLTPALLIYDQNAREIVPFAVNGYFTSSAGFLCVVSVPPNGLAWLQVRAWDARLGTTYEEVAALGMGGYGESPLFQAPGGNPFDLNGLPPPLTGLQSFSLRPVPEPSTWVLLALGGAALGWGARRRPPPP